MPTFADLSRDEQAQQMRETIRVYFDGCNEANVQKIADQFTEDGVHYFPPGLEGPWRGNVTIGERWRNLVLTIGSAWSIERIIVEPETYQAVIEWTHWKTRPGTALRGDEWYRFDPATGKIKEIRAFYASSGDGRDHISMEGFDYAAENYHLEPPVARPHADAQYE